MKTQDYKMQHNWLLSYVYRSAKFDAKFFNFFARLFILFYRLPMYELFGPKVK